MAAFVLLAPRCIVFRSILPPGVISTSLSGLWLRFKVITCFENRGKPRPPQCIRQSTTLHEPFGGLFGPTFVYCSLYRGALYLLPPRADHTNPIQSHPSHYSNVSRCFIYQRWHFYAYLCNCTHTIHILCQKLISTSECNRK